VKKHYRQRHVPPPFVTIRAQIVVDPVPSCLQPPPGQTQRYDGRNLPTARIIADSVEFGPRPGRQWRFSFTTPAWPCTERIAEIAVHQVADIATDCLGPRPCWSKARALVADLGDRLPGLAAKARRNRPPGSPGIIRVSP